MARSVNEAEHAARRNNILAAARRLVYTKGFELMTIQDILDELHISKGAFYHYFDSKGAVLEALVEYMVVNEVLPLILPVVQDPALSAIEKLEHYFDTGMQWKSARKKFMLELVRIWLADENAIVRQKLVSMNLKQVTPLLTAIIRQGMQEGTFTTSYPDQVCLVVIHILHGLNDTILKLLIMDEEDISIQQIEEAVTNYTFALRESMERVLGAPAGSLKLIEPSALQEWFTPSADTLTDSNHPAQNA